VIDRTHAPDAFWEVSADGSNPHPLLPGWKGDRACCGTWVDGGRHFVFSSRVNGATNLWTIADGGGLFHRGPRDPVQLTAGPVGLAFPFAGRGGKRLFAVNISETGELVRYDAAKDAVEPYLGGISASWCSVSRDGQYAAYSSYPDHSLWRSNVDGTEALQLTRPPMGVWASSWSPDGSRIVMMASVPGAPSRIYVASRDGGKLEQIAAEPVSQVDTSFSPDGKSIVYGRLCTEKSETDSDKAIYVYNLESRQRSEIPGSKGLCAPSRSPDGRYIEALDVVHGGAMMIYDFQTRVWKQLVGPGAKHAPRWTADSRHLVFESITGQEDAIYRVRVTDGRIEKIVDTKRFARADVSHSLFSGLAADESPLVMRFRNSFDISAIDLEFR
jgi:Tol biopolymer transport system component